MVTGPRAHITLPVVMVGQMPGWSEDHEIEKLRSRMHNAVNMAAAPDVSSINLVRHPNGGSPQLRRWQCCPNS